MQHIGRTAQDVISQLQDKCFSEGYIVCSRCKTRQKHVTGTHRCPKCGLLITVSDRYGRAIKQAEKENAQMTCGLCRDSGIVRIEMQVDNTLAEYFYRCLCVAGNKRKLAWPLLPLEYIAKE
ncbi:hypothetical protein [Carboxydocella sp. ULO1]|uniref:hypothetical protein n=1 Tax=Carboxydocella sp. ULO1 TaxID=1926599 RepID=UPI0009ABDDC5|nr:hypothetical protein [Carboxydocella sp. ULO1]GAW29383.1 hypothetical protein ULO1_19530 [Carboxydocella sp. ULO1]